MRSGFIRGEHAASWEWTGGELWTGSERTTTGQWANHDCTRCWPLLHWAWTRIGRTAGRGSATHIEMIVDRSNDKPTVNNGVETQWTRGGQRASHECTMDERANNEQQTRNLLNRKQTEIIVHSITLNKNYLLNKGVERSNACATVLNPYWDLIVIGGSFYEFSEICSCPVHLYTLKKSKIFNFE